MRETQRGGRRGGSRRTEGAVHARPLPRPRVDGLPVLGGHDGGSSGEGSGRGSYSRGDACRRVRGMVRLEGEEGGMSASHRMRGAGNGSRRRGHEGGGEEGRCAPLTAALRLNPTPGPTAAACSPHGAHWRGAEAAPGTAQAHCS